MLFALALLAGSCGPDLDGAVHITASMRIHTSDEAGLCEGDFVDLERYIADVETLLGVEMETPLDVYLWDAYAIPTRCGDLSFVQGCYHRVAHAVHATPNSLHHELAHAITADLGLPKIFYVEGIAVAMEVVSTIRYPGIDPAVSLHNRNRTGSFYISAGHFTRWLLDSFGTSKWRQLYSGRGSEREFLKIYGISFDEAREQYLETAAWTYPPVHLRDVPPLPRIGDGWGDTVEFDCSREDAFGHPDGISIFRVLTIVELGYYDLWTSGDAFVIRRRMRDKIESIDDLERARRGDVPLWAPPSTSTGFRSLQGRTLSTLELDAGEYEVSVFDEAWDLDSAEVIVVPHRGPVATVPGEL